MMLKKCLIALPALTASLLFASAARAESVTLTGGWVADFSAAMQEKSNTASTVFQFEGSYKLVTASRGDLYFLLTCVGMEAATKLSESETRTKGGGRCEFKDKDGDKMLAAMETAFDGFVLNVDGGTGKWASATGKLVSRETFTVESDRQLKGYSNAKGHLNLGK